MEGTPNGWTPSPLASAVYTRVFASKTNFRTCAYQQLQLCCALYFSPRRRRRRRAKGLKASHISKWRTVTSGFEMCFAPAPLQLGLAAWVKTRLESSMKNFKPHLICNCFVRPIRGLCTSMAMDHWMHSMANACRLLHV